MRGLGLLGLGLLPQAFLKMAEEPLPQPAAPRPAGRPGRIPSNSEILGLALLGGHAAGSTLGSGINRLMSGAAKAGPRLLEKMGPAEKAVVSLPARAVPDLGAVLGREAKAAGRGLTDAARAASRGANSLADTTRNVRHAIYDRLPAWQRPLAYTREFATDPSMKNFNPYVAAMLGLPIAGGLGLGYGAYHRLRRKGKKQYEPDQDRHATAG